MTPSVSTGIPAESIRSKPNAKRNLLVSNSPISGSESRILKQSKTLVDNGVFEHIDLVGVWEPGLLMQEDLDSRRSVHRVRLRMDGRRKSLIVEALRYVEFAARVVWRFRDSRGWVFSAHSLAVLPLGVAFKVAFRNRLIYDTHELETETAGKTGHRKAAGKVLERALISFVDETVTVNESIGEWYRKEYRLARVHVVRNVPYRAPVVPTGSSILRDAFRISDEALVFLYQGLLSPHRSVEKLLHLFASVRPDRHLVLMGSGDLEGLVREMASRLPNVHFHPPVSPERILEHTSGADVGVHYIENTCLNHFYCLPNKLFEYVMAGIPVMVRDFPEMGGFVRRLECGWTLPDGESAWRAVIEGITRDELERKKKAALRARETLGWHLEERAYLRAFEHLGIGGREE